MPSRRRVVVVGGGVSGLATAHHLVRARPPGVDVVLVEADERLGGKVRTEDLSGHAVDTGPDSLLVRVPAMAALVAELGLAGSVVAPGHPGAYVWSRDRLRRLPPSSVLGVPRRLVPLIGSGLLSPAGLARAGLDLLLPRRRVAAGTDLSVGELVRPRLGAQAFDRLVDPLLGGIHAGRADLLSARSTVPEIDALARGGRSLYLGARRLSAAAGEPGPVLVTLEGGLTRLVQALAAAVDGNGGRAGCDVRLGTRVDLLRRDTTTGGFLLQLSDGSLLEADAVVLATPAFVTAPLLSGIAPEAATAASEVPYADVASVTLAYSREAVTRELDGTGFLVPPEEGLLLVGCSWLPAKWPHLSDPATVLVRAMVGRHGDTRFTSMDDDELVSRVHGELVQTMAMTALPKEAHVRRWPRAMPQYTVGHQDRLDRIDRALEPLPGLVVTGAAYRGVGIASCVAQAQGVAAGLLATLTADRPGEGAP